MSLSAFPSPRDPSPDSIGKATDEMADGDR